MITLQAQTAGSVTIPAAGYQKLFLDIADGILKTKDSSDTVRAFGVGTATDLATTGDPIVIDAGAAPEVGWVLVATAGPVSPIATWQSPGASGVNAPYLQTAVQTGSFSATWGTLVRVDITGGDAVISLATAVGATNQQLGVKIIGAASGNSVTINPFGGQTIDGAADFVMNTDNETLVLRSDGPNILEWT